MFKTMEQQQRYDDTEQNKRLDNFERNVNNNLQEIKNLYLQSLTNNKQSSTQPIQQVQQYVPLQQQQQPNYNDLALKELQEQLHKKNMNEQYLQNEINELKNQMRLMQEKDERKQYAYQQQQPPPQQVQQIHHQQRNTVIKETHIEKTNERHKTKRKFNSGKLESDHDDSDAEREALEGIKDTISQISNHLGIKQSNQSQIKKRTSSKARSVKKQPIVVDDKYDNVEYTAVAAFGFLVAI
jgi:hypothetical protein